MTDFSALRKTMAARGVTQAKLADMLGMRQQQISYYLTERHYPYISFIDRVCKALGCGIDDVVRYVPDPVDVETLADSYAKREAPNVTDIEGGLREAYVQGYNDGQGSTERATERESCAAKECSSHDDKVKQKWLEKGSQDALFKNPDVKPKQKYVRFRLSDSVFTDRDIRNSETSKLLKKMGGSERVFERFRELIDGMDSLDLPKPDKFDFYNELLEDSAVMAYIDGRFDSLLIELTGKIRDLD